MSIEIFTGRRSAGLAFAGVTLMISVLTACGSSSDSGAESADSGTSTSKTTVNEDARAKLPTAIRSKGVMTVANTLAYPPFEMVDENNKPTGLDVELTYALGDALGVKVKLVKTPFDTEIPSLAAGRFDMAMAPFTDTPERRKQVNFVDWLKAGLIVSVPTTNPKNVQGFDDLCGLTVGVSRGSFAATYLPDNTAKSCQAAGKTAPKVVILPDQPGLVLALTTGRVDARVDDSTTSAYFAEKSKGQVKDVGDIEGVSLEGFAIAKDQPDLLEATRLAFQHLIDDGTYGNLLTKYTQTKNAVDSAEINSGLGTS
jgi:polar amino acid transport system substrate-binding protein